MMSVFPCRVGPHKLFPEQRSLILVPCTLQSTQKGTLHAIKAPCSSNLESRRLCSRRSQEGLSHNRPWRVFCTCKNNHSKTPAGISQDTAPQDYLLIVEGVLAALPREDSGEFI